MTFNVPESNPDHEPEDFKFKIPGVSKVWSVTRVKFLPVGVAEEVTSSGTALFDFFGSDQSKAQGDALRKLDRGQWKALTQAWYDDSTVTPGESEASSTS